MASQECHKRHCFVSASRPHPSTSLSQLSTQIIDYILSSRSLGWLIVQHEAYHALQCILFAKLVSGLSGLFIPGSHVSLCLRIVRCQILDVPLWEPPFRKACFSHDEQHDYPKGPNISFVSPLVGGGMKLWRHVQDCAFIRDCAERHSQDKIGEHRPAFT